MINSVSGISFRGEAVLNAADLINSPGKYTTSEVKKDLPSDSYEPQEKKKSHKGAAIATIIGLLTAAYVALGFAVNKGAIKKIDNPEGIIQKAKNFFYSIGENADNLWAKIRARGASNDTPKSEAPTAE